MCAGGGRDTRSSGERNRVARFSSKQAVFLHKKNFLHSKKFFLQSKINFFSQGKKCQVEGCSCTYCLPDKKMERLVIGICPTQNSLSGQIDNWSIFFRDIETPSNNLNANIHGVKLQFHSVKFWEIVTQKGFYCLYKAVTQSLLWILRFLLK